MVPRGLPRKAEALRQGLPGLAKTGPASLVTCLQTGRERDAPGPFSSLTCIFTEVSFLASAYMSQHISEESCFALASVTHYLYLCQFSWMLIQAVNFWYVLVMNDEHTERRYLLYFLLSWGLPAFVVILLLIILRGIYHHSTAQIYGLVYSDLCFIPNAYAALFTAALVPLMCLVVVFVVFIHAYQVTPQWKAYDDIFRGRTNAAEIPLVLYLFALISITWLWGGLHMAYRHLWMLVFFIIFNSLQHRHHRKKPSQAVVALKDS